jgi:hypothetical protein
MPGLLAVGRVAGEAPKEEALLIEQAPHDDRDERREREDPDERP